MDITKQKRCKYCHISIRDYPNPHCVVEGWDDNKVRIVTEEDCEKCEKYESRYIEYPLTINGIENADINFSGLGHCCGELCEIRPCGEEYKDKSFIGIYIGDLPIRILSSFYNKTGILKNEVINNPAIFIPELKKIVFGYESWWRVIKSIDDFSEITTEDIENTWYVRLLKLMLDRKENK